MKAKVQLVPEYPAKYTGEYNGRKITMIPAFDPNKWCLGYDDTDGKSVFAAAAQVPDVISSMLEDAGYDLRSVVWSEVESKRCGFNPFKKFDRPDHWKNFCQSVYFFKNEDADLIKIGESTNHVRRIGQWSQITKSALVLLGVMDGDHNTESAIHKRFAHLRVTGEWFKEHESIRDSIAEFCYMPPAFTKPVRRRKPYKKWWQNS